jgi:hypothetical protein
VTAATDGDLGPVRRVLLAIAGRFGCTEGQVQTIGIGLTVALLAGVIGIPPVLDDRGRAAAEAAFAAPVENPKRELTPLPPPAGDGALAVSGATPQTGEPGPRTRRTSAASGAGGQASGAEASGRPGSSFPLGEAGANGACAVGVRSIDNPRHPAGTAPPAVWIYEPTGAAEASITGGRCDDGRRPVVFLAHGFGQTDPTSYQALITHFVSVGNVVVYPTYTVNDGSRATLEESYRVVDAGFVEAVQQTTRIDTSRAGWWGHSHGGGMIPYLVQQGGARGWGGQARWMSIIAQAYTELVGAEDIGVPTNTEAISVAFEHDALADNRLGNDVFRSLLLPPAQKRHVTVLTGTHGGVPFAAEHGAPEGGNGAGVDAVDTLIFRYADLLELCALFARGCDTDLTTLGAETHAIVAEDPVDVGPYPAVLAECDAGFGPTLNPRIARCGETRIA